MENNSTNNSNSKWWLVFGSTQILISILLGAFGAHTLKEPLGDSLDSYKTAVNYLQLGGFSVLAAVFATTLFAFKGRIFMILNALGTLLFSASILLVLYLKIGLNSSVPTLIALITPLGGTVLIVAWILFIIDVARIKTNR